MTFLLMDTSGEMCVLALAEDDGIVKAVSIFEGKRTLSRRLMGEIDGLLTRNGLALDGLAAFAVGLGPGSFTGVRVGVTTAKTLAQVTGKPLVGVGTLEAYGAISSGIIGLVVPVLPSRRGEVYAAVYENGVCLEAPFAEGTETLMARLQTLPNVTLSGDVRQLPEWTGKSLNQSWTPPDGLAQCAAQRLASGDTDDFLSLVPLYVVTPSISVKKPTPPQAATLPPNKTSKRDGEEVGADPRVCPSYAMPSGLAAPSETPHPPASGGPQRSGEVGSDTEVGS